MPKREFGEMDPNVEDPEGEDETKEAEKIARDQNMEATALKVCKIFKIQSFDIISNFFQSY